MDLHVDLETTSTCNLTKSGVHRYADDPSTRVLCAAFRLGNRRWVWYPGQPVIGSVAAHVRNGGLVWAWNAAFEIALWPKMTKLFWPEVRADQWRCSMAMAAYNALPLSLDMAGQAVSACTVKGDRNLMMKMARPRVNGGFWDQDPAKGRVMLLDLGGYCLNDVDTEFEIGQRVQRELSEPEKIVWKIDQWVNNNGVYVDTDLVDKLTALTDSALKTLNTELSRLTNFVVTSANQSGALVAWLNSYGCMILDVQRATIDKCLAHPDPAAYLPTVRRVLTIRREAAKSSTAKLKAILAGLQADNRLRGLHQYYGAHSGRWAGRRIQPQNFPRPLIDDVDEAVRLIKAGQDVTAAFPGVSQLDIVSSCLRACLAAPPGKRLVQVDYSQVELRVAAWLASENWILDDLRADKDVYVETARRMGSGDRFVGKVACLGLQYQMGWSRFIEFAKAKPFEVEYTEDEAKDLVAAWRNANRNIVRMWGLLDDAVRKALKVPGYVARVFGLLTIQVENDALSIRLPSGRKLFYQQPNLIVDPDNFTGSAITYMGVNSYTRKWERLKTYGGKLFENVVQAIAADLLRSVLYRCHARGLVLVMHVHDEVVIEADEHEAENTLTWVIEQMRQVPKWALDLPIEAEGHVVSAFKK